MTWAVTYLRQPTAQDRKRMAFMTRTPSRELFDTEASANTFADDIRRNDGTAYVGPHGEPTGELT